jgi:hypothetical protein
VIICVKIAQIPFLKLRLGDIFKKYDLNSFGFLERVMFLGVFQVDFRCFLV